MYGRFAGLVWSLFLPSFYRHVARNWGGIGLLYLILLFTVTWIPVLVKTQISFNETIQAEFPKIAPKLPDITIKNGKVSSPVEQPFEIKDDNGRLIFVLDTTGKINNLEQTQAVFLVTETKIHQRDPNNNRIQIHDLAQFPDFEFTADVVQGWLDFIGTWLGVACYPFCMFGSLVRALIIMLIASIVGVIVNSATGNAVSYGGLLRMAACGLTLSVYIDTALTFTNYQTPPFWFFMATGMTSLYVAFGVVATGPLPGFHLDHDFDDDRYADDYGANRRGRERRREDSSNTGYEAD